MISIRGLLKKRKEETTLFSLKENYKIFAGAKENVFGWKTEEKLSVRVLLLFNAKLATRDAMEKFRPWKSSAYFSFFSASLRKLKSSSWVVVIVRIIPPWPFFCPRKRYVAIIHCTFLLSRIWNFRGHLCQPTTRRVAAPNDVALNPIKNIVCGCLSPHFDVYVLYFIFYS